LIFLRFSVDYQDNKLNIEVKALVIEKLNPQKGKDQRNLLEMTFDILSSIPYLKQTMKAIWLVIVILRIVTISWAFFIGGWSYVIEGGFLHKFPSYLLGVFTFGLMFYYWEQREKQKNSQITQSQ